MYFHYIKTALHYQAKNKIFHIINIIGLAIGMSVSILIINYVCFEFSFDKMHSKRERIYRVESKFYEDNHLTDDWATSAFGYGSAISNEMTGIEDYVRIGNVIHSEQTVIYKEKRSLENGIVYVGPSFFTVFDFKLKEGVINDQLKQPNTVVITEEVALRFFGNETPIGKLITFANRSNFIDCEITGVIENFPKNSHISFNYLISYETLPDYQKEFWYQHRVYTYLLLSTRKDPQEIEKQFPIIAEKYKTRNALKNKKWAVTLVPIEKIHFNPQKQYERETKGNKHSISILIIIAIAIMLIGWINYINLSTARSIERAREIGIRKVVGAFRHQLIHQLMIESWLTNLSAIILAVFLVFVLKPLLNHIIKESVGLFILKQPFFWISLTVILISGTLISGFYPAFIMTRVKPSVFMKGNYFSSNSARITRQILVIFQFAAALFLICGAFIIYKQVRFMQNQELGADISKTVVLKFPVSRETLIQKVATFAETLRQESMISSVTVAGSVPGMEVGFSASNRLLDDENEQHRLYEMLTVDENFIETFGLELLAGRSFQEKFGNESNNLIINESTMTILGFHNPEDAIGKRILLEGETEPVNIIGVLKNWHQRGLGNPYTPIMLLMNDRLGWIPPRIIAIKTLNSHPPDHVLEQIKRYWNLYFPESGFEYFYLDNYFGAQYNNDIRFGSIVSILTVLIFFISLLGLWALTSYTSLTKTKEIGVRKILGAHVYNIIYLFSKEIIFLVLVSLVIATPVSLYVMRNWLLNYAFRIKINFDIYLAGAILTIVIAVITVNWQIWKVASKNPANALRYE